MSKIDFTRTHKLAVNKTEDSLGLIKKGAQSKVITLRLNATDEERLGKIIEFVNNGRAKNLDRSAILKELIKIASVNPNILKGL